jgi:PPK2 family polyphosphate:nucleotide phosphotransferase
MAQSHRFNLSRFIVPVGKYTSLSSYDPGYIGQLDGEKQSKKTLREDIKDLADAQELIWATKQRSVLIIFQAMDAAGKDGTIKHVMSGINPQGCNVFSFKAPTEEERLHHFLWRPQKYLPSRGMITIFNRSYYEEVLVVRVHPELLQKSWLPIDLENAPLKKVWQSRYEEINKFEEHMTKNGIIVIKFFLHLSKEEQLRRFISRLETSEKQWKFTMSDFEERKYWDEYQEVFEKALNATSTDVAPWYVVPADNKWYMRALVADVISFRIAELNLSLPKINKTTKAQLEKFAVQFNKELGKK